MYRPERAFPFPNADACRARHRQSRSRRSDADGTAARAAGGLPSFLKFAITEPDALRRFVGGCWPGFDGVPGTVDPRVAGALLGRMPAYAEALRAALRAAGFYAGVAEGEAEPALYAALQAY